MDPDKVNEPTEESSIEHINKLINASDDVVVEDKEVIINAEQKREVKPEPKPVSKPVVKPTVQKQEPPKKVQPQVRREPVSFKNSDHNIHIKKFVKRPIEKKIIVRGGERPKMKPKKVKEGNNLWIWISVIVLGLVLLAILIFKNPQPAPVENQTINTLAATVNGEPIYMADIDAKYNSLNPLIQGVTSKETILNQSIEELLLLQESKKQDVRIDEKDVTGEIEGFKETNNLNDSAFEQILTSQGLTLEGLETIIRNRLMIRGLLNKTILNIEISEDDARDYYDENKEQFTVPEKVTVRHILVMITANVTDAQAEAKIKELQDSDEDFCDLVEENTDDPASIPNCGTYTFGRGEMVKEFEDESFDLAINKTGIVKTSYGWHLIQKLDHLKPYIIEFKDVEENITSALRDIKAQENFMKLLDDLKEKAVIVNYLAGDTQVDIDKVVPEDTKIDVIEEVEETEETVENTTIVEETEEVEETVENTTLAEENEEIVENNTTVEPEVVENTTVVEETEPEEVVAAPKDFTQCLKDNSVVMYGVSWCKSCESNRQALGDAMENIKYVDCADPTNPQIQTKECDDAGIKGYPTWIINKEVYAGSQTQESLSNILGC